MTDFPRLQYLIGLAFVLIVIALARSANTRLRVTLAVIAVAALGYNTMKLLPYLPESDRADSEQACNGARSFSVMVANVKMGNRSAEVLIELVRSRSPDLFLALETDEWGDAELATLDREMPHKVQRITGGYFGMHLFSRLVLSETKTIFPVEQDAPAILTKVALRSGQEVFFVGLHPRPPHPGQSSIGRDAQLLWAAFQARDAKAPALIAGDLNAVPWEQTVERMQRVGGLIDPRERHGYQATYDAQSWWMSWPLDHLLHQEGLTVSSFDVLPGVGSDHHPIEVTLCHGPSGVPAPQIQDGDVERAERDIDLALRSAGERQ
ncbi:endonuclease/exonuclease/phosphatase family protein [Marinovum sp.]|uniref:endonuclease/exonuclease/phosphatase family protein n=1 Tax=Marinovum sp. TaxID=2024839 RepID=UPI003A905516